VTKRFRASLVFMKIGTMTITLKGVNELTLYLVTDVDETGYTRAPGDAVEQVRIS
jgi:hypothetical protein